MYCEQAYAERRQLLFLKLTDEYGASNPACLDV